MDTGQVQGIRSAALEADRCFLRGASPVFSGLHGLGDVGYSRQYPGFLRLRRTSGKFQESQRAQRGDDHVYRQSPQRYRADIPLCPHTRPRYKENHPQLLRNRRLFRARRDAGSRLVRPLR